MSLVYGQPLGSVRNRVVLESRSSRSKHPKRIDAECRTQWKFDQSKNGRNDCQDSAPGSPRQQAVSRHQGQRRRAYCRNNYQWPQTPHPHRVERPMPTAAKHPSIVAEVMGCKGAEKKGADQAAEHAKPTEDAPQNPQRLQMPMHPRHIHGHRRLRIPRIHWLRWSYLRSAFGTEMNSLRDWSSTCLTDHLTPPNT
jgi:hypothetical protein